MGRDYDHRLGFVDGVKAAGAWLTRMGLNYPQDIFEEPPKGEHGETVDTCSARALRFATDVWPEVMFRDVMEQFEKDPHGLTEPAAVQTMSVAVNLTDEGPLMASTLRTISTILHGSEVPFDLNGIVKEVLALKNRTTAPRHAFRRSAQPNICADCLKTFAEGLHILPGFHEFRSTTDFPLYCVKCNHMQDQPWHKKS